MSDAFSGAQLRGAVDLSGLVRRASSPDGAVGDGIVFATDDLDFARVVELSRTVPVVVEFGDPRVPPTGVEAVVRGYQGRVVLAVVDTATSPQLAQAFQVQQVPTYAAVIGGRPLPLFAGLMPEEEFREVIEQVLQVAAQQGVTGVVEPVQEGEAEPEPLPPLHQEAYDAIEAGDYGVAIAAYEKAIAQDPRDALAVAGLAQVRLLARLHGADADEADRRLASGDVEGALDWLLEAFATSPDREAVRSRLLDAFEIVGADDPRVAAARRRLASLLY